jgi:hypothetical protein
LPTAKTGYAGMTEQWRSDEFRITPELLADLKGDLAAAGEGRWTNVYGEMQGRGTRVYLSIQLLGDVTDPVLDDYRSTIMHLVAPRLPVKIEGDWAWCVGITSACGEALGAVDAIDFAHHRQ